MFLPDALMQSVLKRPCLYKMSTSLYSPWISKHHQRYRSHVFLDGLNTSLKSADETTLLMLIQEELSVWILKSISESLSCGRVALDECVLMGVTRGVFSSQLSISRASALVNAPYDDSWENICAMTFEVSCIYRGNVSFPLYLYWVVSHTAKWSEKFITNKHFYIRLVLGSSVKGLILFKLPTECTFFHHHTNNPWGCSN